MCGVFLCLLLPQFLQLYGKLCIRLLFFSGYNESLAYFLRLGLQVYGYLCVGD